MGMVFSVLTFLNYSVAGEPRPSLFLSVIVIMMGGLLLGIRGPIVVSILLAAQHLIFVSLYAAGIIAPAGYSARTLTKCVPGHQPAIY